VKQPKRLTINLTVSPETKAAIENAAKAKRQSVSEYLRQLHWADVARTQP
jgi:uncharacterized protein (DUF1778 family)